MIIKGQYQVDYGSGLQIKCPACNSVGIFTNVDSCNDLVEVNSSIRMGQRLCPNNKCRCHVFVVYGYSKGVIKVYPVSPIDFNKDDIPVRISAALSEAIVCHAEGLYISSAIMVRRTLEELCEDKGCKGGNLHQRIKELEKCITIPVDLIPALDELRIIGNDAAHIEAKAYDQIGAEEVEISIELAKEILKATYQMGSLVARLKGLKKPVK